MEIEMKYTRQTLSVKQHKALTTLLPATPLIYLVVSDVTFTSRVGRKHAYSPPPMKFPPGRKRCIF